MGLAGAILPAGRPGDARRSPRSTTSSSRAARWPGSCGWTCRSTSRTWPRSSRTASWSSSPTGSTGYSFSAGGPILDPQSRNLVVTPIAGYLSAIRSIVVSPHQVVRCQRPRRPRGAGLDRRPRGPPDRGRRRGRGAGPGAAHPVRRAGRRDAVLGPAADEGPAAAVLTMASEARPGRRRPAAGARGRDLALIDRLRLPLAAGPQRAHRRDRGRQEPADRCAGAGAGRARRHDAGPARGGERAGRGAVRPAAGAADRRARGRRDRALHGAPRRRDGHGRAARRWRRAGLVEIHGQHDQQRLLDEDWQRDLLDAFGGHGERARGGRGGRGALARRTGRRSRSWRWTRASCSAGSRSWSTRRPRSTRRACGRARRPRSPASWPRRSTARRSPPGAADGPRDAARRGQRGPRAGRAGRAGAAVARPPRRPLGAAGGPARRPRGGGRGRRRRGPRRSPRPWTTTRRRSRALEERLGEIHRLLRRYGDDEAAVIEHGDAVGGRGGPPARARGRAGAPRRRGRAAAAGGRRRGGVASRSCGAARPASWARAVVGAVLAELGFPADAFDVALGRRPAARDDPAVEVDGDAVAFDATGIDTVVFTFRPERRASRPGRSRGSRRAASCRASRWP